MKVRSTLSVLNKSLKVDLQDKEPQKSSTSISFDKKDENDLNFRSRKFKDHSLDEKRVIILYTWNAAKENGQELPDEINENQWNELLRAESISHLRKMIQ
jgi:hypothetical protein